MRRKFEFYYFLFVLLSWSSISFGAPTELSFSLENILNQVWKSSPLLQGQRIQADLASGDRWRRFIFNEPQFSYSNSDDDTAHSYGLSLAVAFPGKSFAFARLDTAKANGQRAEFFAKKYDLTKTITQAYLDCAAAQASFEIQTLTAADLETVSKTLKSLYETGHSTQAEKIGSELQLRQAQFDLMTAQDRTQVFCKKLESTLAVAGERFSSFLASKAVLPDDLNPQIILELGDLTADQNRAASLIDSAVASAQTAWWSQLPDLNLSVNRNQYLYLPGSPSGREWATTYGVSVTLPLLFPFHESVEARRLKSQSQMDQNVAELQKVTANSDQQDAAQEYQRSRNRLRELRLKDLALAEALVDSTYSAYRAGKLGYAELVLSRKTLADIRNQDIQLRISIVNSHLRCLKHCDQINSKNQLDEKTL